MTTPLTGRASPIAPEPDAPLFEAAPATDLVINGMPVLTGDAAKARAQELLKSNENIELITGTFEGVNRIDDVVAVHGNMIFKRPIGDQTPIAALEGLAVRTINYDQETEVGRFVANELNAGAPMVMILAPGEDYNSASQIDSHLYNEERGNRFLNTMSKEHGIHPYDFALITSTTKTDGSAFTVEPATDDATPQHQMVAAFINKSAYAAMTPEDKIYYEQQHEAVLPGSARVNDRIHWKYNVGYQKGTYEQLPSSILFHEKTHQAANR